MCVGIFSGVLWYHSRHDKCNRDRSEDAGNAITLASIIIIAGVFVLYIVSRSFIPMDKIECSTREYEIASLQDNSTIHGSFILGSGTIESVPTYFFYYKVYGGGYKLGKVQYYDMTIIEDDSFTPGVYKAWFQHTPCNKKLNRWVIRKQSKYYYYIYVPSGTIIKNFHLDTKF
jgi:hypothetical protein